MAPFLAAANSLDFGSNNLALVAGRNRPGIPSEAEVCETGPAVRSRLRSVS